MHHTGHFLQNYLSAATPTHRQSLTIALTNHSHTLRVLQIVLHNFTIKTNQKYNRSAI
ncbi:hypothetical protein DSUL_120011 [Desulfovibrionales bacterium]